MQRTGVSLNPFIAMAVAEKVGVAGAVEFFEKRDAGGKRKCARISCDRTEYPAITQGRATELRLPRAL